MSDDVIGDYLAKHSTANMRINGIADRLLRLRDQHGGGRNQFSVCLGEAPVRGRFFTKDMFGLPDKPHARQLNTEFSGSIFCALNLERVGGTKLQGEPHFLRVPPSTYVQARGRRECCDGVCVALHLNAWADGVTLCCGSDPLSIASPWMDLYDTAKLVAWLDEHSTPMKQTDSRGAVYLDGLLQPNVLNRVQE